MTPDRPAAGQPPDRRQALLDQLLAERYGPPVRSDRPRHPFKPDTRTNTAIRRYHLDMETRR